MKTRAGFTGLELLITACVLGVLFVLLVPMCVARDHAPQPLERFTCERVPRTWSADVWTDTFTGRQYLVIPQTGIVELDPVPQVEVERR